MKIIPNYTEINESYKLETIIMKIIPDYPEINESSKLEAGNYQDENWRRPTSEKDFILYSI